MANAISLGSSDKAEVLKSKLMALGYRAESKTTTTSRDEQWLLLKNVGTVGTAQIDRILVGSPQIRREKTSCAKQCLIKHKKASYMAFLYST